MVLKRGKYCECKSCGRKIEEISKRCQYCGVLSPSVRARCPKCRSDVFTWKLNPINSQGALAGLITLGPYGALGGAIMETGVVKCTCCNCGKKRTPYT